MNAKEWLIVVDYQNDFVNPESGSLYVAWAENLSSEINNIMKETKEKGWIVIGSREMHPQGHISFASNFIWKEAITVSWPNEKTMITYEEVKNWTQLNNWLSPTAEFSVEELKIYLEINGDQALWPDHCVEQTQWAQYFQELDTSLLDTEVIKWKEVDNHPYSAFWGFEEESKKPLIKILQEAKVETLKVVWVATDYCDLATVLDGVKNFSVEFIEKASAWVDPSTTLEAINEMREKGAKII